MDGGGILAAEGDHSRESIVKIDLVQEELWEKFDKTGNEMIVTKVGRYSY